jgi:hypothetical protein
MEQQRELMIAAPQVVSLELSSGMQGLMKV